MTVLKQLRELTPGRCQRKWEGRPHREAAAHPYPSAGISRIRFKGWSRVWRRSQPAFTGPPSDGPDFLPNRIEGQPSKSRRQRRGLDLFAFAWTGVRDRLHGLPQTAVQFSDFGT